MRPRKTLTLAFAALAAVAGCTLNRSALRQTGEDFLGQIGGNAQVIEPKRCLLTVVMLPRPIHDKAVNEAVWSSADEQAVPSDMRRALESNGLRMGILTGGLPAEVEAAINAPPPNRVDPAEFNQPEGTPALINLAQSLPTLTLLLNRDGRALGKDYQDASGYFRVTPTHDGPAGVTLRFVPEIHHGPIQRRYDALPNTGGTLNTMQFMPKDGQQEDSLRELAASVTLQPGQVAVVGCNPDRKGSLGAFLFTRAETNSDRLIQKVLFIRASRTNLGQPGSQPDAKPHLVPEEPPDLAATATATATAAARKDATPKDPPPANTPAATDHAEPPSRDDHVTRAGMPGL
jgi:hypothetical protein